GHMPKDGSGTYAGYNPADSADAIAQLEGLRAKGAEFLVIPATAFWWLDHYGEFRRHLGLYYPEVAREDNVCAIFALGGADVDRRYEYQRLLDRMRTVADSNLPPAARVLVVSRGDPECLRLGERQAGHFPQQPDGVYAGHYPADSAAAIGHLEALRDRGFDFLLVPATACWRFD